MVGAHWEALEGLVSRGLTDLEEAAVRAGREMRTMLLEAEGKGALFCSGRNLVNTVTCDNVGTRKCLMSSMIQLERIRGRVLEWPLGFLVMSLIKCGWRQRN